RGARGVAKSLKNLIHEGGFAQAGLGDERQESMVALDCFGEGVQRLAVGAAWVQIGRIGRDAEGLLAKLIEIQKHGRNLRPQRSRQIIPPRLPHRRSGTTETHKTTASGV